ncbi:MAG: tetratricopeptide (TPR) repeat protein [Gammaproteobacteria bacterium]|jgi:tetratricopeptide (TPR) repeat protein
MKQKIIKAKTLYVGILIFVNLFFSACSSTLIQKNKTVPVEDRNAPVAKHQDVIADSRVVTNDEIILESSQSEFNPEPAVNREDIRREESISEQSNSPVALAFLEDADKYATAGDSSRAVASLERGLDIEPKNPWLWNRLAAERLQQKMWDKAITFANKSNAFASGHNQLQKYNWQIIVEARIALGDEEGANKAKEMVQRFSREKT